MAALGYNLLIGTCVFSILENEHREAVITPIEKQKELVKKRLALRMAKQQEKYVRALHPNGLFKRYCRLASWGIVANRLELHFSLAKQHAEKQAWFDNLYVLRADEHRTVQLFFGQHPVSTHGVKDHERGAALVISQNTLGGVVVLLYPFETDAIKRSKPHVIWGVLDGPEDLSEPLLLRVIDDFLTYSRVTSVLFSESRIDRFRVSWLERRSRLIEGAAGRMTLWHSTIAALVAGSIATAGIYIAWIFDNDLKWAEPVAGLVALATGWLAFKVQLGQSAIDKAVAKEEADRADKAHQQRLKNERAKGRHID